MSNSTGWNATVELRGVRVPLRHPAQVEIEAASTGLRGRFIGALTAIADLVRGGAELRRMRRRAASVLAPEFARLAAELSVWECVMVWSVFQGAMAAETADLVRRAHDEAMAKKASGIGHRASGEEGRKAEVRRRTPRGAMVEFGPGEPRPQWFNAGVMSGGNKS